MLYSLFQVIAFFKIKSWMMNNILLWFIMFSFRFFTFCWINPFCPFDSWTGVRVCLSVPACPAQRVMPSTGGRVGGRWCALWEGGSSARSSSMSGASSGVCADSLPDAFPESSERESSPSAASTRCLLPNGSTTGRWCAGPNATR